MVGGGRRRGPNGVERQWSNGGSVCRDAACLVLLVLCCLSARAAALRPIRERVASSSGLSSWSDEQPFLRRADSDFGPYAPWNITGTYTGTWRFLDDTNGSSRLFDFGKSNGVSIFELVSTPTKLSGVHYVQGAVTFRDVFDSGHDFGVNHMRVEGVYMCPFRQLRMVASSGTDGEPGQEEYFLSNPYHLLGAFSSQVFQESPKDKIRRRKSLMNVLDKHCSIEIAAQLAPVAHSQNGGMFLYMFKKNNELSPKITLHLQVHNPQKPTPVGVLLSVYCPERLYKMYELCY